MRYTIFLLILILSEGAFSQSWILQSYIPQSGPTPFTRFAGVSAVVGNIAYTGLGAGQGPPGNGSESLKDWWSYNPLTNTWVQLSDFPGTARYDAAIFVIGTNIYVGGGDENYPKNAQNEGFYVSDFYVFDTTTNTWSQIASMPLAFGEMFSFALNGKGYVTCGQKKNFPNSPYLKVTYSFDPSTNVWTQKSDFPGHARQYPVGFTIGSKAYVGGGYYGSWFGSFPDGFTPVYLNDFYSYDPVTDVWTSLGTTANGVDISGIIAQAVGFSTCDKGYLVFGNVDPWNGNHPATCCSPNLMEYDPVGNTWSLKSSLPVAMPMAVGWQINGTLYAGLGYAGGNALYSYQLYSVVPSTEPICSTSNLIVTNAPVGYSLDWTSSNSKLTISSSGLATRLNNFNGQVTATATIGGCPTPYQISRNLIVGTGLTDPLIEQKTVNCSDPQHYSILGRVTPAPGNATYKWYIGSATGTNFVLKLTTTGNSATVPGGVIDNLYHTLKVEISNVCNTPVSTANVEGRYRASCSGGGGGNMMVVFPNPAGTKLTIQQAIDTESLSDKSVVTDNLSIKQQYSVKLYDPFGMLVSNSITENGELTIDVSGLPNGLYTLRVESESGTETKTIVVNH